jgi:hypothetical protein
VRGTYEIRERWEITIKFKPKKIEEKKPSERPRCRQKGNTKMILTDIRCEGFNWIHQPPDKHRWRYLVTTVMNLRVSWNGGGLSWLAKPLSVSKKKRWLWLLWTDFRLKIWSWAQRKGSTLRQTAVMSLGTDRTHLHVKYLGVIYNGRITLRLHIEMIEAITLKIFIKVYSLFKILRLCTKIKLSQAVP